MNKKLYAVLILCWLCCSLQSIASDSSDTGCFTSNPLLPSSYLKGWVGVGANIATGSLIIATGSLSTKSGRDFAKKLVDGAAQATVSQITSHGSIFALGAVFGGAVVGAWYKNVEEPEIIAETRGQDFSH